MHPRVDRTALKVNQVAIVGLLALAFVLQGVWLVALTAAAMAIGAAWPEAGPFRLAYARVLRPAGLLRPAVVEDDPAPHRFALGMGSACLGVALLCFLVGLPVLGWAFSLLVVALAGVNLFAGFCLGCFVHYQLARRGLLRSARRGWTA